MPIELNGNVYVYCEHCTWSGPAKDAAQDDEGEAICVNCREYLTVEE